MSEITVDLLLKLAKQAPRYTSYPTAPEWTPIEPDIYAEQLAISPSPLSLYFHIPFCQTMCLFCACSVILNRRPENEVRYVDYLKREIDLVRAHLGSKKHVTQLHFGGGTPTKLALPLFETLFYHITEAFEIDFSGEVAIEIDPRTVTADRGEKLRHLRRWGFNRVSFGVQDLDPVVQEAIKRRQSREMTEETYSLARELGFEGINIDLIYGLPHQTRESFALTIDAILRLKPDRIALFSYAKVPWLKPHQKAIPDSALPSTTEKFAIYADARRALTEGGYVAIGMDHFALPHDELAVAYKSKALGRNFQGYTVKKTEESLGLGVTAIGFLNNRYFQNQKDLETYYAALDRGQLPSHRGKILSEEDKLRKWVIHTLMCDFAIDKKAFKERFGVDFNLHFRHDIEKDLVHDTPEKLIVTPMGELFIRNIAMAFDAYLKKESVTPRFSQAV